MKHRYQKKTSGYRFTIHPTKSKPTKELSPHAIARRDALNKFEEMQEKKLTQDYWDTL